MVSGGAEASLAIAHHERMQLDISLYVPGDSVCLADLPHGTSLGRGDGRSVDVTRLKWSGEHSGGTEKKSSDVSEYHGDGTLRMWRMWVGV